MGFMDGWMNQSYEESRLKNLEKSFNTAKKLGVNECQKCGFCCNKRTCIPTPNELINISKLFGLTIKETINKYFCIDRTTFSDTYFVKPAGINNIDLVGKFIPSDRTFNEGKCIFLTDNNLCKIYDIRPEAAKSQHCWKESITIEDRNYGWTEGFLETIIGNIEEGI